MRDYADEANLHTRLYAMRGRLLLLKDYVLLAKSQEEASHDKTVGVQESVAEEENIFQEQIAKIAPLAEATGQYTPLFLAFFRQFEALNVKLILAKAFGLQIQSQWYDIGPYAVLKRSLLNETLTPANIQPYLENTYLKDVLEDVSSYALMETRVDMCAARVLYEASALFSSEAKTDFQHLMGRRIAITSTLLSLRLKRTYQWDDERIRLYLEKFNQIFDGKTWLHLKVTEEVLDRYLEQSRASGGQEPSLADIEHHLEQYYYSWIAARFHGDFHSVYCVVAYLWLLFYQIRNLFKIVEGRRFGLSSDLILARIVCNA